MSETLDLAGDTITVTQKSTGQTFTIEPFEFLDDVRKIFQAVLDANKDMNDYWRGISNRVAELCPGILLTMGEADNLAAEVGILAAKKKHRQEQSLKNAQNSAYSMASGSEASPEKKSKD